MSLRSKPKRPKRLHRGIELVWSSERWRWRARKSLRGVPLVGTVRDTQKEAREDYLRLGRPKALASQASLQEALRAAHDDAVKRGVRQITLEGKYLYASTVIMRSIRGSTPMAAVTPQVIEGFLEGLLRLKRAPNTISHFLWLIGKAATVSGLPNPCLGVIKQYKGRLNQIRQPPQALCLTDLRVIFERMLATDVPGAQRDVYVYQVILQTGVRLWELHALQVQDVDLGRGLLHLRHSKTQSLRSQPIVNQEPFLALMAGKEPTDSLVGLSRFQIGYKTREWRRRLGLPLFTCRVLRHTYATGLLDSGASLAEVRDLMGHSLTSTATLRYLHSSCAGRTRALTKLMDTFAQS